MNKEEYFKICINLAKQAAKRKEVPIGAIVVKNGKIVAKAYNLREHRHDITAHAEILAIKQAAKRLKHWHLSDCSLFVTLKPCSMCNSVIKQSRIKNVYYLCEKLDYKKEFDKTIYQQFDIAGLSCEYSAILSSFFANKR